MVVGSKVGRMVVLLEQQGLVLQMLVGRTGMMVGRTVGRTGMLVGRMVGKMDLVLLVQQVQQV
jgi:hypothetical protein